MAVSARKQIFTALEDAGVEVQEVKWFFKGPKDRGWYYRTGVNEEWIMIGDNKKEALAAVAAMPDPNKVEKPKFQGRVTPETHPEMFDEFNNPVEAPFGHR